MPKTMARLVPSAALFLLVAAAYLPAVPGDFLWDDDRYVSANPLLSSPTGLLRVWFEPGATIQYYPLTFTTFWIEHRLWGLNPTGYHLVNIGLHALCATLLWLVLRRLALPGAWLAAAIFALHPVQVESVAWITERKNVLCGVFFFATALAYLEFAATGPTVAATQRRSRWYAAGLCLYLLALLSKSVACTLPAALLIVVAWQHRRLAWRDFRPLVPFFLLGAGMALVTAWVERTHVGAAGEAWTLGPGERLLLAGRITWFYLFNLIWPSPVVFVYPRWTIDSQIWWQYLYPVSVLAAMGILWLLRSRSGSGSFVAGLYYLATLAPAMGFFSVYYMQYSYVADHFQYLACAGPIAAIAALLTMVLEPRATASPSALPRLIPIARSAVCVLVLASLGTLTWKQSHAYRNLETLWRDTLSKNPHAWMAHLNLANILQEQGHWDEAMPHYREALRQQPGDSDVQHGLASALADRGRVDEATAHYLKAVQLNPRAVLALNNLGNLCLQQGRFDDALSWYVRAIQANPAVPHGYYNAGLLFLRRGQYDQAVRYCTEAAKLDPRNPAIRTNLGHALLKLNRQEQAVVQLREALIVAPDFPAAHANIALALMQSGKIGEATEHFRLALRDLPKDPMLHYYYGLALQEAGQPSQSIEHLLAAWRLNSDSPEILNALAWTLATREGLRPEDCPDPLPLAEKACALTNRQQPMLLDTLAATYAAAGRFTEAAITTTQAAELAESLGQHALASECTRRLATYQKHRPYRESEAAVPLAHPPNLEAPPRR